MNLARPHPLRIALWVCLTALVLAPATARPDGYWFRYTNPYRANPTAVLDSRRHRMIVMGGGEPEYNPLNDLWAESLDAPFGWSRVDGPSSALPSMDGSPSVYDPDGDRLLVFRMRGDGALVGSISLIAPRWNGLFTEGGIPSPRSGHRVVWDSVRKRAMMFGGTNQDTPADVWALELSPQPTWVQLLPTGSGPRGRTDPAIVYDSVGDRLIVIGGYGKPDDPFASPGPLSDVWALDIATNSWSRLNPTGPAPTLKVGLPAVFDATRNRILILRSTSEGGSVQLNLATTSWSAAINAPDVAKFSAVLDPTTDRVVLFGGTKSTSSEPNFTTQFLDLTRIRWTVANTLAPPIRRFAVGRPCFDTVRNRFVIFTATNSGGVEPWTISSDRGEWAPLAIAGVGPSRFPTFAFYDARRDRVLAYSQVGTDWELWAVELEGAVRWARVPLVGPARPPANSSFTLDPLRDQLFAYYPNLGVWRLALAGDARWDSVSTTGSPPRAIHGGGSEFVGAFDPFGDRWIVSGGSTSTFSSDEIGIWALSMATSEWTTIVPAGSSLPRNAAWAASVDLQRARAVSFGGYRDTRTAGFPLIGGQTWSYLGTDNDPPLQTSRNQAFDPIGDRLLVVNSSEDMWALCWNLPATPSIECDSTLVVEPSDSLLTTFRLHGAFRIDERVFTNVRCSRSWPIAGRLDTLVALGRGFPSDSPLTVVIPDSADPGPVQLELSGFFEHEAFRTRCVQTIMVSRARNGISLASVASTAGWVRLEWARAGVTTGEIVERREQGGSWVALGTPRDSLQHLLYRDDDVTPGATYFYRVRFSARGREVVTEEIQVAVPLVHAIAQSSTLELAGPNPGPQLMLRVTLSDAEPCRLEVFDVCGRVRYREEIGGAAGESVHEVRRGLDPGVYLVRMSHGGRRATVRAVVLN